MRLFKTIGYFSITLMAGLNATSVALCDEPVAGAPSKKNADEHPYQQWVPQQTGASTQQELQQSPVLAQDVTPAPTTPDERKTVEEHKKVSEETTVQVPKIKTVYVAPLGTVEGSEIIRQKVINGLIKSGVVSVVDSPDKADATLTGASEMSHRHHLFVNVSPYATFVGGRTRYTAECVARLVSKQDKVLWTADLTSRRFFASHSPRGASSNVADKIVKEITAIISPAEKQLAAK